MRTSVRFAATLACAVGLCACAKTQVTERQPGFQGKLARPDHIFVYDFVATPEEVPPDSGLANHPSVGSEAPAPKQVALGREVGAELAKDLVAEIDAMGLMAVRGNDESPKKEGDLVIRGYLLSVDAGSAVERVAIGFGKGGAELKTAVEGFVVTDQGLRKLGGGTVDSGGGKTPGAVIPLAAAVATHNPIGLVVSTGVKLGEEETGKSTIEGRAKDTAGKIAAQLKPRFQQQGWIP